MQQESSRYDLLNFDWPWIEPEYFCRSLHHREIVKYSSRKIVLTCWKVVTIKGFSAKINHSPHDVMMYRRNIIIQIHGSVLLVCHVMYWCNSTNNKIMQSLKKLASDTQKNARLFLWYYKIECSILLYDRTRRGRVKQPRSNCI